VVWEDYNDVHKLDYSVYLFLCMPAICVSKECIMKSRCQTLIAECKRIREYGSCIIRYDLLYNYIGASMRYNECV
jgi:hypothetical protein